MEKVTGGPPESPTRRAATIARVGARYGFGFAFGGRLPRRRGPADTGRLGAPLGVGLSLRRPPAPPPRSRRHRAHRPAASPLFGGTRPHLRGVREVPIRPGGSPPPRRG